MAVPRPQSLKFLAYREVTLKAIATFLRYIQTNKCYKKMAVDLESLNTFNKFQLRFRDPSFYFTSIKIHT